MTRPASHRARRGKGTPSPTADELPALSAFLSGYLHQDFALEHETPGHALRAFLSECSEPERKALAADWRRFAEAVDGHPWRQVRGALSRVGGSWVPPSREALDALFALLDER